MDRSKQSISLLKVNTQSICAEKLEFQLMIEDVKPDVIVACETWLKPVNSCHPDMTLLSEKTGRMANVKVIIAIKTGLTAEQLMIPTPCEMFAVKIQTSNTPLIVVGI